MGKVNFVTRSGNLASHFDSSEFVNALCSAGGKGGKGGLALPFMRYIQPQTKLLGSLALLFSPSLVNVERKATLDTQDCKVRDQH